MIRSCGSCDNYTDRVCPVCGGRVTLDIPELGQPTVHDWFELSYAQYLTVPRSVLQSMPYEWQARFAQCLDELDATIEWRPTEGRYWVQLKDAKGRYAEDPLMDYERGRRRIPHKDEVPV